MPKRISSKSVDLIPQCRTAADAIANEPKYPAAAPDATTLNGFATTLQAQDNSIATAEAALRVLRQSQGQTIAAARAAMGKVDTATDLIYGAGDARKGNFGLPPAPPRGNGVLDKLPIDGLRDGVSPASLFLDFGSDEDAASYQVQAATDAEMKTVVAEVTVTASEYEFTGLTARTQYWFRVRCVGTGGKFGPWSDVVTRVANL